MSAFLLTMQFFFWNKKIKNISLIFSILSITFLFLHHTSKIGKDLKVWEHSGYLKRVVKYIKITIWSINGTLLNSSKKDFVQMDFAIPFKNNTILVWNVLSKYLFRYVVPGPFTYRITDTPKYRQL